jgi:hypothetical protein
LKPSGATPITVNARPFNVIGFPTIHAFPPNLCFHKLWLSTATWVSEPWPGVSGVKKRPRNGVMPSTSK